MTVKPKPSIHISIICTRMESLLLDFGRIEFCCGDAAVEAQQRRETNELTMSLFTINQQLMID